MPSPQATLLRTHSSPVPTQMMSGFFWNQATSPIDALPYLSKIGSQVVPALTDLYTPPEAVATRTLLKSASSASMSEMRPLMLAGPMLRHLRSRTRSWSGRLRGDRRREREEDQGQEEPGEKGSSGVHPQSPLINATADGKGAMAGSILHDLRLAAVG